MSETEMTAEHQHGHDHGGHDHDGHDHDHDHHTGHDSSWTDKNRSHWDKTAHSYDTEPWQKEFINKIHEFVLANISWIGVNFNDPSTAFETGTPGDRHTIRVLDYACGPGTITNILRSHATNFIGIDLSPNMVQAYNKRFDSDNEDRDPSAHAFVGNLLHPKDKDSDAKKFQDREFYDFDLVAVGLGFHHFENPKQATALLAERVKPGGVFWIIDLVTHEKTDSSIPAAHTVVHHGFSEEQVQQMFAGAGLVDISIVRMPGVVLLGGTVKRELFMARGRKL